MFLFVLQREQADLSFHFLLEILLVLLYPSLNMNGVMDTSL